MDSVTWTVDSYSSIYSHCYSLEGYNMDTQHDSNGDYEDYEGDDELEIALITSTFTLIIFILLAFLILGIYDHSVIPISTR